MWPSSERRGGGFTLIEVVVTLATLVVVLVVAGQLLFQTKRAAQRQQLQVETRQLARTASDYVTTLLRGATDLSTMGQLRNPLAIVSWVWVGKAQGQGGVTPGCPGDGCRQASFNNVTAADGFADPGTDIVTFAWPSTAVTLRPARWPGFDAASNADWWFDLGCSGADADAENLALFKTLTGCCDARGWSRPLVLEDAEGRTFFYQITNFLDAQNGDTCSNVPGDCFDPVRGAAVPCVHVVANPGNDAVNPPGGFRNWSDPVSLKIGVEFRSFRVCNGWLQQRRGIFDPSTDNDCTPTSTTWNSGAWTSLVPSVEDFQVTYAFRDGTVHNTSAATTIPRTGSVPVQGSPADPFDATAIVALRVILTVRSPREVALEGKAPSRRPAAADHPAAATEDRFYRYQVVSEAMLRNRMPGS